MILVTVGTEKYPFNRLMEWIDRLIEDNFIDPKKEEIVIQYGSCTIVPQGVKNYSILKETDFSNLVEQARLIIAHCGEGTIDLLASLDKPFILVPRQAEYNEHVDNHQMELAKELEKQAIPISYSPKDLACFLADPVLAKFSLTPAEYYTQTSFFLEKRFETESVREQLIEELIGSFDLATAFE